MPSFNMYLNYMQWKFSF